MRHDNYTIVQWDQGALEVFTLIALLQRARIEADFTMELVSRYKGADHSRFPDADSLIGHLGALLIRQDFILRVETSEDGKVFTPNNVHFSKLNDYLKDNTAKQQ